MLNDKTRQRTPMHDPFNRLFAAMEIRYEKSRTIDDLVRIIDCLQYKLIPRAATEEDLAINYLQLGRRLHTQYIITHEPQSLLRATDYFKKIVDLLPAAHNTAVRAITCWLYAAVHTYNLNRGLADLQAALSAAQREIEKNVSSHIPELRMATAAGLYIRYEAESQDQDLHAAICLQEDYLHNLPSQETKRKGALANLALYLSERYCKDGNSQDLHRAISTIEEAETCNNDLELEALGGFWSKWSTLLWLRYREHGMIRDLDSAIQKAESALSISPKHHPERAAWLGDLCMLLYYKYQSRNLVNDLTAAVQVGREALSVVDSDGSFRMHVLNNLSLVLLARYHRTGVKADLNESVLLCRGAVATSSSQIGYQTALNNLSNRLAIRSHETGNESDLDEAIQNFRDVLSLTSENDPELGRYMYNYAVCLRKKYEQTQVTATLQGAIEAMRESLTHTSCNHPERAQRLITLAQTTSGDHKSPPANLEDIIGLYMEASEYPTAPPLTRIEALRYVLDLLIDDKQWARAYRVAEKTLLELFPLISFQAGDRNDKEHMIAYLNGLAANLCSLSLLLGNDASSALQLLELGRGMILSMELDLRSDLTKLREEHPEIHKELDSLRHVLSMDAELVDMLTADEARRHVQRRIEAAESLPKVIAKIQCLPGFERFQQTPTAAELINEAKVGGPIVVFNCARIRNDAIIVTANGIHSIELKGLSIGQLYDWAAFMMTSVRAAHPSKAAAIKKDFESILSKLWVEAVRPVVLHLHLTASSSMEDLPRIWWIGVGPMSRLPFHLSADYTGKTGESMLQFAISSYTPTIKALSRSREKSFALARASCTELLMISSPGNPKDGLITSAEEAAAIKGAGESRLRMKHLDQPSVDMALEHIKTHRIVHFACHGFSVPNCPSESYLAIADGSLAAEGAEKAEHLTVKAVSRVSTAQAQIVYLSSCLGAENSSEDLVDEVIHLASAFQLAGFSHVLGGMWTITNRVCVAFARAFYDSLLGDNACQDAHRRVAEAYHSAMTTVKRSEPNPLRWGPFIHLGA